MSVINKMLRDLDKRQTGSSGHSGPHALALDFGTTSVPGGAVHKRPVRARKTPWVKLLLAGLFVMAAGAVGLGYLGRLVIPFVSPAAPPMPVSAAPVVPAPQIAAVAKPVVIQPVPKPVAVPVLVAVAPAKVTLPPEPVVVVQKPLPPPPVAKSAVAAPVPAATASAPAPDVTPRQQLASREAMGQAQTLWNSGSHDAAIDLMQQAVVATERAAAQSPTAAQTELLITMAREYARMLMAESRPAPVWELLTRLEPVLLDQVDLWAVRGNAAQRLGRHQDSVHAYLTALQSRPAEQRWLLGAAVSLAALGQTASATEMADKARSVGVVSKDVQTYLRQMGVVVKD